MKIILAISGILFAAALFVVTFIAWLTIKNKTIDEMVKAEKDQFNS